VIALTQQELGERAGYHTMTVAKLEQGTQEPAWPPVLALAHALGVEIGKTVGRPQILSTPCVSMVRRNLAVGEQEDATTERARV
jgi:transcriptional regulator with XRE-family HTH domain